MQLWIQGSDSFTKWFLFRFTSLAGGVKKWFSDINYAQTIIWNNNDIRIDNRSIFYKSCGENGNVYVRELIFESDNKQSHDFYRQKGLLKSALNPGFGRVKSPLCPGARGAGVSINWCITLWRAYTFAFKKTGRIWVFGIFNH